MLISLLYIQGVLKKLETLGYSTGGYYDATFTHGTLEKKTTWVYTNCVTLTNYFRLAE